MSISFTNGRVDRITEFVPTWARTLYANELEPFSKARQNKAAASYADIKKIAKHIGGDAVNVLIPLQKQKVCEGTIVGESTLHILQQTQENNQFIAHFKSSLDKQVDVGQDVAIVYSSKYKSHMKQIGG